MGMTIVKGFKKDFEKNLVKSELRLGLKDYYPDIAIDEESVIANIIVRLQVLLNLPVEMVVKNIGREIDTAINIFYKMYISDIGMILADRIVKRVMELEYYEFRKNKDS